MHHGRQFITLPFRVLTASACALLSCSCPGRQAPPRFYAPLLPSSAGGGVELEPEEARHAVRVLRLQAGSTLDLCDGRGSVVRCEVTHTDRNSASVS